MTLPASRRHDGARPTDRRFGRAPRVLPLTLLLALVVPLASCSKDADVLARVRDQTITVSQLTEVARGNLPQLVGHPDSVKARLLNDLVDRELLVQGAFAEHLDQSPGFAAFRGRLEDQVLREALYQRLLGGPFPVSDAETRALYERRATATRARIVYSNQEVVIRQAARDLARGEEFAAVADRYNPTGMVPPGGDIGFLQPGSMLPPLDDLLRTSAPGQVVGPVAAGTEGWFILRVEERRPERQPPFEQIGPQLAEMIRQRKQRAAFARVFEQLKTEYQVEVLPGAPQLMSSRLRAAPGEGGVTQPAPPPGAEERRKMLARFQGGAYTLGEAYDDLVGGAGGRVDLSAIPTVERWIQAQTVERAAVLEARRRHLGDEPEVARRLRERLNNYLLDGYYQLAVLGRISIEPEDFRLAYERYRSSFVRLQRARVVSVTIADSAAAATLAALAARAPSLREAAATAALGARTAEESLGFPAESPLWTQFENHLTMMRAGEIAGPFQVPGGWLLFQLVEKQQDAPPFESLSPSQQAQLQGVATEMKREARLAALTDSLRHAYAPVVVYTDRLRRVPWPPAPSGPGS